LKIIQEVITLAIFVPFAVFYMGQPLKLDFLWAGLCLLGAVYFFSGVVGFFARLPTRPRIASSPWGRGLG
jgi:Putative member of DMT superfamily (DUF486)